jgi:hypothetical protein
MPMAGRILLAFVSVVAACDPPRPAAPRGRVDVASASAPSAAAPMTGVRFVHADPDGEVAPMVVRLQNEALHEHRHLLVYVGATWCEPCQYFHRAADAHALDTAFPDLTLLEFDLDHDAERLQRAGYVSRMIPLFTRPGADGRATERHIEGSIHGPGSVAEMSPRLRALLE